MLRSATFILSPHNALTSTVKPQTIPTQLPWEKVISAYADVPATHSQKLTSMAYQSPYANLTLDLYRTSAR